MTSVVEFNGFISQTILMAVIANRGCFSRGEGDRVRPQSSSSIRILFNKKVVPESEETAMLRPGSAQALDKAASQ
jgi:hypothetical protein